uniref:Uncharacterized protein n=1 Tax=Panagrolaimus sp. ES5 TaxID=591445 RepID=A0AC34F518_9BILA
MSLFLEERIAEQEIEDPEKDKIIFTFSLALGINYLHEPGKNKDIKVHGAFKTTYKMGSEKWHFNLTTKNIVIGTVTDTLLEGNIKDSFWNGICFLSYTLFWDNDMRLELYSSTRIQMVKINDSDLFSTPRGYMSRFAEAFTETKVSRIVMSIELHLPVKYFYYPFERPSNEIWSRNCCAEYPEYIKNGGNLAFFGESDYLIKCLDGSVPARKLTLNTFCSLNVKNFMKTDALIVEHSIDVMKPLIIFLHTLCFEMPESYDLEYVKRLFKLLESFKPEKRLMLDNTIEKSLCLKFVKETHNFNSVLQWIHISFKHKVNVLKRMIASLIAEKYYHKFLDMFPENVTKKF